MAKTAKTRKFNKLVGQYDKLRAKRNMSSYKNLDKYLDAVYSNNQEYMNKHIKIFADTKTKRESFKDEVKKMINQTNPETKKKFTVKQAIDYFQRKNSFRSDDQRGFEVVMTRMQKDSPDAYKKFRMAVGWKNKISSEYVTYKGARGKWMDYEYYDPNTGKHFMMSIKISPDKDGVQDVVIKELDMQKIQDAAESVIESYND